MELRVKKKHFKSTNENPLCARTEQEDERTVIVFFSFFPILQMAFNSIRRVFPKTPIHDPRAHEIIQSSLY